MTKMESNFIHLFLCSSPKNILQLLFLGQLKLLNEIWRTRDANVGDTEIGALKWLSAEISPKTDL
jgi:hypothetical protein